MNRRARSWLLIFAAYILHPCSSATYAVREESYCADSTKAVYSGLCLQETKSIMEEAQEGRDSLTYLLALAFFFFCNQQFDFVGTHAAFMWSIFLTIRQ